MTKNWTKIRSKVKDFIESEIYPIEVKLAQQNKESAELLTSVMNLAKEEKIWALGHPKDIGGGGMPFMEYVYINEVVGRSSYAMVALGTHSLQDSIMLREYASEKWKEEYLEPLVQGEIFPSFGMTEPEVASSDPTQLQTSALLENGKWKINGRKWFTTGAARAAYTTVMCKTEFDSSSHGSFSMIIVPTDNPGYKIIRETPVLGINGGHYEVEYDNVEVPEENLLGPRGHGFLIAQKRLGPGRIFHCMRWLGQAQRAFDLMASRMHQRETFGTPLAEKQLLQKFVFDSACEIQASRQLTLDAAKRIDQGDDARIEIGLIKVVGAKMLHNVIDRAIQVYGAKGLTDDTPLSLMYRHAREARIYDGPDEVHIQSVAKRILKHYENNGSGWDFGERDASLISSVNE
jgi:alkylation response protein AidB-like acyl-CoA dehydrogenase|tara:strand:+ start:9761 stop:10972 length:1212 start_codon:yes stop_codon:yes gene_type:complete